MLNSLFKSLPYGTDSFEFGIVEELIYDIGEPNKSDKDIEAGKKVDISKKFTGYVQVRKFVDNTVVKSLFLVPLAGKSMFFGGMPEKGSICFMCNMGGARVILGFVPVPMNMMIQARHELDNMVEGEILMQSSTYDAAMKDFYSAASFHLDTYGRMIIESGDDAFRIIVGDLLSNEYTEDVTYLKDTITEEVICFQENYKNGRYRRSVDKQGNTIFNTLSALWDVGGDEIHRITGKYIVSSGEQIRLEQEGSFLDISSTGIKLSTVSDFAIKAMGGASINSASFLSLFSFLDLSLATSGSVVIKALKEIMLSCAEKITVTSTKDSVSVEAFTDALIKAVSGSIKLDAAVQAEIVAKVSVLLGSASATEPVLLGNITYADLMSHQHIGNMGYPVTRADVVNPAIFSKIKSIKVFTE
jgi:hypothetical protein